MNELLQNQERSSRTSHHSTKPTHNKEKELENEPREPKQIYIQIQNIFLVAIYTRLLETKKILKKHQTLQLIQIPTKNHQQQSTTTTNVLHTLQRIQSTQTHSPRNKIPQNSAKLRKTSTHLFQEIARQAIVQPDWQALVDVEAPRLRGDERVVATTRRRSVAGSRRHGERRSKNLIPSGSAKWRRSRLPT